MQYDGTVHQILKELPTSRTPSFSSHEAEKSKGKDVQQNSLASFSLHFIFPRTDDRESRGPRETHRTAIQVDNVEVSLCRFKQYIDSIKA